MVDLRRDDELPLCTLRIGEDIIGLTCRVARNEGDLGLQFRSFATGGHHKLFQYIQGRSERDLKRAVRTPAGAEESESGP